VALWSLHPRPSLSDLGGGWISYGVPIRPPLAPCASHPSPAAVAHRSSLPPLLIHAHGRSPRKGSIKAPRARARKRPVGTVTAPQARTPRCGSLGELFWLNPQPPRTSTIPSTSSCRPSIFFYSGFFLTCRSCSVFVGNAREYSPSAAVEGPRTNHPSVARSTYSRSASAP
jgi:hypothetical protein